MEHIWEELTAEAGKSNCDKREVACIIYDTFAKQIVGRGHNHHKDGVCDCKTTKTAIHAEQAAVDNMLYLQRKRLRSQLMAFITRPPCENCKRVLDRYVSEVRYRSQS